jgi:hypothetical protein
MEVAMLTVEQIIEYAQRTIAQDRLAGNAAGLRQTQYAVGFLKDAAEAAGDTETARRFRLLAAQAANKRDDVTGDD